MERAQGRSRREIADQALASVTFDRLKMIAGTELAEELKDTAKALGHKLTLQALAADPAWRAMVDQTLDDATAERHD